MDQGDDLPGHVSGQGGLAVLVVDDLDGRPPALQRDHRTGEAAPVRPVQPGCTDHVTRVGQGVEHGSLTGQLGTSIGGPRRRDVLLGIRPLGGPGEDVVGRHLHQTRTAGLAGRGDVGCAATVDRQRLLLVRLGIVDAGPGRAVDDHIRPEGGQGRSDGSGIGHIQAGPVQAGYGLPAAAQDGDQLTAQHAAGPGNQPPDHSARPAPCGTASLAAASGPGTSSVDTCTTGPTPASRHACNSTCTPATLLATKGAAPLIDRSTWVSAAKFITASWPGTSEPTSAASAMSPWTNRSRGLAATGARFARFPA